MDPASARGSVSKRGFPATEALGLKCEPRLRRQELFRRARRERPWRVRETRRDARAARSAKRTGASPSLDAATLAAVARPLAERAKEGLNFSRKMVASFGTASHIASMLSDRFEDRREMQASV